MYSVEVKEFIADSEERPAVVELEAEPEAGPEVGVGLARRPEVLLPSTSCGLYG